MSSKVSKLEFTSPVLPVNFTVSGSTEKTAELIAQLVKQAIEELSLPYKEKSNCFGQEAQQLTIRWILEHKVMTDPLKISKINVCKFGDFMGKAHPRAPLKTLSIVADFATWLFIYDDMIEKCNSHHDLEKFHERTITMMDGQRPNENDHPLNQGLFNIMKRIREVSRSIHWKQRLLRDVGGYCQSTLWELSNREKEKVPSLQNYQTKRPDTSGTKVMFDFIEFVEGLNIPSELFEGDYIQEIRRLGANLVNWENDLLSAPKEMLSRDIHNLVFVYKADCNTDYQDAVHCVVADLKGDLSRFECLAREVPDFGPYTDDVTKYVACVREWIAAHHFWAKESPRYLNYFTESSK